MTNKQMKVWSTWLVIQEMQIKTFVRYLFTPQSNLKNGNKGVVLQMLVNTYSKWTFICAGRSVNWCIVFENNVTLSSKGEYAYSMTELFHS